MSPKVNSRFYAFLGQTGQLDDKKAIVEMISLGRTSSSKDLTDAEVEKYLNQVQPKKKFEPKGGAECDKKRKKLIAIFLSMGGTKDDAVSFSENMKGITKKFNDYNGKELSLIIKLAEEKKAKLIKTINK